ncbi:MAG: hypothetical protein K9H84_07630 [Bacteroidales bacterium]|nr:hypothetical protein [Bacteroidales bacterium]
MILLTGFFGCEIINPEDPIPGYIYIEDIKTNTDPGEGTDKQQFTDAWIYKDQDLVGAFELPAMVPVIAEGEHTITVKPGIKINGISSTRAAYPFIQQYETTVNFKPEKIDTLGIQTNYLDDVDFPWNSAGQEDFEQGGVSLDSTSRSDAQIIRQSNDVFEGNNAGLIYLDSAGMQFEIESIDDFDYPGENTPTFLELHYKADNSFAVGVKLYQYTGQIIMNPILIINPKETWNKIYLNLTPTLTRENATTHYKIYFSGNVNENLSSANIYLDNIKLVTSK